MPRRLAAFVVSALVGFVLGPGVAVAVTTTAADRTFTYDAPANARVEVHTIEDAVLRSRQPRFALEGSVSSPAEARGTSTTSLSRSVATNTVDDALAYATRAEKLDHIFVPRHNLDPLVQQLGSREAVVQQMVNSVKGLTPASGTFEIPVTIGGQTVVVRGAVVNGVTKIGTAFTP